MYNNPFYIPGYNPTMTMASPNLMRGMSATMPATRALASTTRAANAGGLFSRLGSSLSGIKAINWGGLINNTSKTLGIINQTIPIVRQVGPMVNNMKSMLRVASLFKDETDTKVTTNTKTTTNKPTTTNLNTNNNPKNIYTRNNNLIETTTSQQSKTNSYPPKEEYNEAPTFFINT